MPLLLAPTSLDVRGMVTGPPDYPTAEACIRILPLIGSLDHTSEQCSKPTQQVQQVADRSMAGSVRSAAARVHIFDGLRSGSRDHQQPFANFQLHPA
jgi:hypothetical protein